MLSNKVAVVANSHTQIPKITFKYIISKATRVTWAQAFQNNMGSYKLMEKENLQSSKKIIPNLKI